MTGGARAPTEIFGQLLISFMHNTTGRAREAASTTSKIENNVTFGLAAADQ
jgi:hypothetical protein